jgi:acetyl esterase/lipase
MTGMRFKRHVLFGLTIALCTGAVAIIVAVAGGQIAANPDAAGTLGNRQLMKPAMAADIPAAAEASRMDARSAQQETRRLPPDHADIPYGPHERNTLDIWLSGSSSPAPLVVYFHGGGFRHGDKRMIRRRLRDALLEAGFSVASVNYRLSDSAPFPAPMHDAARAMQYLRYHADSYHIDPARIGASGVSAGGGISLWLAFHDDLSDPDSDDPVSRLSTRPGAAVVYETQTTYDPREIMKLFNTTHVDEALIPFFGMQEADDVSNPDFHDLFYEASAVNHLTVDDAPVMLYYSQADKPLEANTPGRVHIHHPAFGHLLCERMDRLGIPCVLKLREDYGNPSGMIRDSVQFFIEAFGNGNRQQRQ